MSEKEAEVWVSVREIIHQGQINVELLSTSERKANQGEKSIRRLQYLSDDSDTEGGKKSKGKKKIKKKSKSTEKRWGDVLGVGKVRRTEIRATELYLLTQELKKMACKEEEEYNYTDLSPLGLIRVHSQWAIQRVIAEYAFSMSSSLWSDGQKSEIQLGVQNTLNKVRAFDEAFMLQIDGLINLGHAGRKSCMVLLAKIIELEEKHDKEPVHGFLRPPQKYKERVLKRLRQKIMKQFETRKQLIGDEHSRSDDQDALSKALGILDFVTDDVVMACDEIDPCFPPEYKMFNFFVQEYHKNTVDMISFFIEGSLSAKDILSLLKFVSDYYLSLKRLGISKTSELIQPELLGEGRNQQLHERYLKILHQFMTEWCNNIFNSEAKELQLREEPPETEDGEKYVTSGPVILFQMLNQQMDVAEKSTQDIIRDLAIEIRPSLLEFQTKYFNIIVQEEKRFISEEENCPGGLLEYMMASVNNNFKCAEFTVKLLDRFRLKLSDTSLQQSETCMNEVEEGFRNLAKNCMVSLINIVFHDLGKLFVDCFTSKWYTNDIMADIIETLRDYSKDLSDHLIPYFFNKAMYESMDRLIITYLETMLTKQSVFKVPEVSKMSTEVEISITFFSQFIMEKRVKKNFAPLIELSEFITLNEKQLQNSRIREHFPDMPGPFLEKILMKRSDLGKDSVSKIMDSINKSFQRFITSSNVSPEPTIFSKSSKIQDLSKTEKK